jgi:hypothetical protein
MCSQVYPIPRRELESVYRAIRPIPIYETIKKIEVLVRVGWLYLSGEARFIILQGSFSDLVDHTAPYQVS